MGINIFIILGPGVYLFSSRLMINNFEKALKCNWGDAVMCLPQIIIDEAVNSSSTFSMIC